MDALEKEPLLINSRKNQDKKIFFEYKPLLNISRTNFDLKFEIARTDPRVFIIIWDFNYLG